MTYMGTFHSDELSIYGDDVFDDDLYEDWDEEEQKQYADYDDILLSYPEEDDYEEHEYDELLEEYPEW